MYHYVCKVINKINKVKCYTRGVLLFGKKVYIEKNVTFLGCENIQFGSNCKVLQGSIINAANGKIIFDDDVTICVSSILNSAGGIINLGRGTTVGDFCNLYGQGGLNIGKDVMIASCVQIVPNEHNYQNVSVAIKFQEESSKGIKIADGCWVGTNVAILDGSNIGRNTVLAAGSIVNKDIPAYSVTAGVPSRVIKQFNFDKQCWIDA